MVHADDIAVWFKTRWAAGSGISTQVPGGLWNGRPDEASTGAYGVFLISMTENEYTSKSEISKWEISLRIYGDQSAALKAQTIQYTVGAAFPPTVSSANSALREGIVVQLLRKKSEAPTTFPMRGVNDVVISDFAWECMTDGNPRVQ